MAIRVRFPAYPHRVLALWWQGGKRRLRTSRCPSRGRLGTLKTPSCQWRGCPAAGQNLETGLLSRHYIAEISLNVTLNNNQPTNQSWGLGVWTAMYRGYIAEISQNALFSCRTSHIVCILMSHWNIKDTSEGFMFFAPSSSHKHKIILLYVY